MREFESALLPGVASAGVWVGQRTGKGTPQPNHTHPSTHPLTRTHTHPFTGAHALGRTPTTWKTTSSHAKQTNTHPATATHPGKARLPPLIGKNLGLYFVGNIFLCNFKVLLSKK